MAELSKTAKASMVKEAKKKIEEESVEEAIRQIRIDRQAGLFIVREDRIDKLLAAYDKIVAETQELAKAAVGLMETIIPEAIVKLEPGVPPADFNASHINMAEVPAHEHDEHHMVDFGHHTTHPHPEGAD